MLMSVSSSVLVELDALGVQGWRREVALVLAAQLDEEPNASMARELRALMADLGSRGGGQKRVSALDELRAKREAKGVSSDKSSAGVVGSGAARKR